MYIYKRVRKSTTYSRKESGIWKRRALPRGCRKVSKPFRFPDDPNQKSTLKFVDPAVKEGYWEAWETLFLARMSPPDKESLAVLRVGLEQVIKATLRDQLLEHAVNSLLIILNYYELLRVGYRALDVSRTSAIMGYTVILDVCFANSNYVFKWYTEGRWLNIKKRK